MAGLLLLWECWVAGFLPMRLAWLLDSLRDSRFGTATFHHHLPVPPSPPFRPHRNDCHLLISMQFMVDEFATDDYLDDE